MAKWRYGLVLDAGSSGTRLHIYRWLNSKRARQEADEYQLHSLPVVRTKKNWTKKIHPGVSTFGDHPEDVGPEHLQELFDHALEIIPSGSVEETPIFLLATAGVRLLPTQQKESLLQHICSYAREHTKFSLPDCDLHVQVIPGETEGLYGWVAANYLLGGFDSPEKHDHGKGHHTYGFLDMGGASAQIAFAPNSTEVQKHGDDLKLIRMRTLDGASSEYRIFVTSWLGYGVHEARRRYVEKLLDAVTTKDELPDPCLPTGLTLTTTGDLQLPDKVNGADPLLIGTGKFSECLVKTNLLLGKDTPCEKAPCLFNGVHVPSIDFDVNHFVGVSEYWHTTQGIFEKGHHDKAYDLESYQERVRSFCTQDWASISKGIEAETWGSIDEATAAEVCFKASWIISVLHDGIGIPRLGLETMSENGSNGTKKVLDGASSKGFTDPFQAIHKIDDTEVSWTLGKMVLYAASEIPPANVSSFPVGFGSNVAGVPADFQLAGGSATLEPHANGTFDSEHEPEDSWRDTLFEGRTPHRIPGLFIFMTILFIATFLLCGKDRRSRFIHKILVTFTRGNVHGSGIQTSLRARRSLFTNKLPSFPLRSSPRVHDRLLEAGMVAPDDFELDDVDFEADEREYSDDSTTSTLGKTSGWATPIFSRPSVLGSMDNGSNESVGKATTGKGVIGNAMDRSGLIVRTESRERLPTLADGGKRSRSRIESPAKGRKGMGKLAEQ